ncbi:MAG TPA: aminotransferase class III-fold pyridoxal phosphate-dependent enzyme, partial [Saprospiraceae bacterium]|nr:aminotransferase class III-fold pyridoxal phosphate-dependent enzyme [Saprospiraceae bacterium]
MKFSTRKGTDFIKDDFGVKIPIQSLKTYYPWLYDISAHIEWILLENKPGLAALLFINSTSPNTTSKAISERIKSRNEEMQSQLQPFEFTHRHLERFSVVSSAPPVTRKGTISRQLLFSQYGELIDQLRNPYCEASHIEVIESDTKSSLYKFSDPHMVGLLEALKLDIHFEKGEGDYLYYQKEGEYVKVLDLVGGFGAGLLGHNHPTIKQVILDFLDSDRPAINTQGSLYHYPALLARDLNKLFSQKTGRYFKVQFGNSGSEAMEIALHHAYFEWWTRLEKRRDEQLQRYGASKEIDVAALWEQNMKLAAQAAAGILVINNCFHGYSSGSRSLLNDKKQRFYFAGLLG